MNQFKRKLSEPDAVALLSELRDGATTSAQLVSTHLARIDQTHASINAATQIFHREALEQAHHLDLHGDKSLPLFGLPCSVKETFGLAGHEVTAGSMRMQPEQHTQDAEIVRRLKAAGAIVIARSNIPELAMTAESTNPRFGRTNNPLDTNRVAGGSSGGEGALVGSGGSVFGVGSDILGSIRIPAAFCGVVGFKPHSASVDQRGTWPVVTGATKSWLGLGPLTRSVRDAELVYNVIADTPVPPPEPGPARLVVPRVFALSMQNRCISDALAAASATLAQHGYQRDERDFSDIGKLYLQIPKLILDDFYDSWIRLLSRPGQRFSPWKELLAQLTGKPTIDSGLLRWMLIAPMMKPRSAARVEAITAQFARARAHYHALLGNNGVMVLPTLGLLAPEHGKMNRLSLKPGINGMFTSYTMGNYLDLPSIAIPAWKFCDAATGLPASISVMCAPGAEAKLFAAAKLVEAALN